MCLAIPVRIIKLDGTHAEVDANGVRRDADVRFVDDVKAGDYILLHAGFAIEKIDEQQARETLELLKNIYYDQ
ncbi:MAG TPA: HypC/HybG/HupF family hydrogenase formation chaperone [Candidatus Omnitrophota bacterium]|nr:HypC/HybG/HupF family hydrogenase formation chaperone [Candidatus Omnitrophota bacterium]HNQ50854.1 HypC/HybG/HupF family hydrogenase formation chaperone [Candidatus Omnitrophota bacterium]HQO37935.1 HypC/HybG/HupF family hydrogenase formation chaperone [Candidatus Omnitrophota bacterium]HQQ05458.1 HypC/HybG/HupF family hydrogenase formation chaperone [Candidatus Omnitrophota bacterium]